MASRAVITSCSNEILGKYWYSIISRYDDLIDKYYICLSTKGVSPESFPFSPKNVFIRGVYPINIAEAVEKMEEDVALIMHDDCFIYDRQFLIDCFKQAEEGNVLTPLASNTAPPAEVAKLMMEKLGNDATFFLTLVFISKANLDKTRKQFLGIKMLKGEVCPVLGKLEFEISGDQGFALALDLLHAGVNIIPLEEPNTLKISHGGDIPVKPRWVHCQGMSYGFLSELDVRNCHLASVRETWKLRLAWLLEFIGVDDSDLLDFVNYNRTFRKWK